MGSASVWVMTPSKETPKNPHAVALGKRGGMSGKGVAKRRDPAHYLAMAEASALVRRNKAILNAQK